MIFEYHNCLFASWLGNSTNWINGFSVKMMLNESVVKLLICGVMFKKILNANFVITSLIMFRLLQRGRAVFAKKSSINRTPML